MSFSLSQGAPQVINTLVWKQPFEKSSNFWLLDMPLELLKRVMDFVLTTGTHLKGTIYLHEERKRFVFTESKDAPDGQAMEGNCSKGTSRICRCDTIQSSTPADYSTNIIAGQRSLTTQSYVTDFHGTRSGRKLIGRNCASCSSI